VIKRKSDNLDVTSRYTVAFKESPLRQPKVTYVDSVNERNTPGIVAYGTGERAIRKSPEQRFRLRRDYNCSHLHIEAPIGREQPDANLTITANRAQQTRRDYGRRGERHV
jgi:hypothetical protein